MDLFHHIDIDADPQAIYAAVATQRGLRAWWTADSDCDEKVGGKAEFGFGGRAMVFRMNIVAMEPGKRVVWECIGDQSEWEGTRLEWQVGEGLQTTNGLWLRHTGWKDNTLFSASCNSTWGDLMFNLKDYVEGKATSPKWAE